MLIFAFPEPVPFEAKQPEEKKKVIPFYPTKKNPTMEGSGFVLGAFDKYPVHPDEPPLERVCGPDRKSNITYLSPQKPPVEGAEKKIFRPTNTYKSGVTRSVMAMSINRYVHVWLALGHGAHALQVHQRG